MCTLTWSREGTRYEVHFNRDERRTRASAQPPRSAVLRGMPYLAPVDPEGGGTWLAVNAAGLTLALLNDYRARRGSAAAAPSSRGLLVLELVDGLDAGEVERRLSTRDLARFQPFSLFAFTPGADVLAFAWDGAVLSSDVAGDDDRPVSSSSRDQAGAELHRTRLFERELERNAGRVTSQMLARFHRSHEPERGTHSPCMHREDAATQSYSRVVVGPRQVHFEYVAGPPCRGERQPSVVLERAAAARALDGPRAGQVGQRFSVNGP
jgi:hypothetical protein